MQKILAKILNVKFDGILAIRSNLIMRKQIAPLLKEELEKDMKTILVNAVNTFIIKEVGISDRMYKILEKYPNRKIILTGANDKEMEKFGLNNIPYEVFTLKHNPEKTNPEYYKIMLKHFNLNSEDVIYFEHSQAAITSAQTVGIITHYYDQDKKDLSALEKFINENL